MSVLNVILLIIAIVAAAPLLFVALECLLSLAPIRRRLENEEYVDGRVGVLIPAHDEESVIGATLKTVLPQMRDGDRVLVVADNCSDGTAEAARAAGAEVVERTDVDRRGKGFALQFGMEHLADDPPETVIVVDADCALAPGSARALHSQVQHSGVPAQSINLMTGPERMSPRVAVAVLAFLVKNLVRPLGLHRLGMPCLLTGTGMAFPWSLVKDADFAGGDIVEDMRLGLDLARKGAPARLCFGAMVESVFPEDGAAGTTQRTRWEHGHLRTLLTHAPRLMVDAIRLRSLSIFALTLELSVPPLALLVMGEIALIAALGLAAALGTSATPFALLAISFSLFGIGIALGWARHGRERVPARALVAIPFYIASKIPLYFAFLRRPERTWVRTARGGPAGKGATK